jgi:SAM-dependent methyltransferase
MATPDPRVVVRAGYDRIERAYGKWRRLEDGPVRARFIPELLDAFTTGARVLDIGCGDGVRSAPLIQHLSWVGVDVSWVQLSLARESFPSARLAQADAARLPFRPASFDAVVAWYSLIHVPRDEHAVVFRTITDLLRPGGRTIFTLGTNDDPMGTEDDWLGVPMFWSGFDIDTSVRLIRASRLEIESAEVVEEDEGEGETTGFLWIVARKAVEV